MSKPAATRYYGNRLQANRSHLSVILETVQVAPEPARWHRWRRSQIAETFASVRVSAPCYRFAEDIRLLAIVETELKLSQIQRQVLRADIVVGADDSALEQRPKRINATGYALCLAHIPVPWRTALMPKAVTSQLLVAVCFIGSDQFRLCRETALRTNPSTYRDRLSRSSCRPRCPCGKSRR